MTGISDPVRHPLPLGGVESWRQEVARCRTDLAGSVGRLIPVVAPPMVARRLGIAATPYIGIGLGMVALPALGRRSRGWAVALAGGALAGWWLVRAVPPPPGEAVAPTLASGSGAGHDVVDVLMAAHRRIGMLFDAVMAADGASQRRERLAVLVDFLQRHEHAEQEVVRPQLRALSPETESVIDERLAEEADADRAVAALVSRDVDDPSFAGRLADLRAMVVAHATREERLEFPLLRARLSSRRCQELASQVRKQQAEEA